MTLSIIAFDLQNASHLLAIRSTNVTGHFVKHNRLLWLTGFQQLWLAHFYHISVFTCCFLKGPLPCGSFVVRFLDCGHPYFWNCYSAISVDVVGVELYVSYLFDCTCVQARVKFIDQLISRLPYCLKKTKSMQSKHCNPH